MVRMTGAVVEGKADDFNCVDCNRTDMESQAYFFRCLQCSNTYRCMVCSLIATKMLPKEATLHATRSSLSEYRGDEFHRSYACKGSNEIIGSKCESNPVNALVPKTMPFFYNGFNQDSTCINCAIVKGSFEEQAIKSPFGHVYI